MTTGAGPQQLLTITIINVQRESLCNMRKMEIVIISLIIFGSLIGMIYIAGFFNQEPLRVENKESILTGVSSMPAQYFYDYMLLFSFSRDSDVAFGCLDILLSFRKNYTYSCKKELIHLNFYKIINRLPEPLTEFIGASVKFFAEDVHVFNTGNLTLENFRIKDITPGLRNSQLEFCGHIPFANNTWVDIANITCNQ